MRSPRSVLVAAAMVACSLGACSLGCSRPPENPTAGYELVHAELGVHYRWSFDPAPHFDHAPPNPIESTTPRNRFLAVLGRWRVTEDERAPSAPYVLSQDRSDGYPSRILVQHLGFAGVHARVKCRIDDGREDASCGVVFAARAEDEYLVARLDAVGRDVRLLRVVGRTEIELARFPAEVRRGVWHELTVWSKGGDVLVQVDGELRLTARVDEGSGREGDLGRLGLFARGAASFDDLSALALDRAE